MPVIDATPCPNCARPLDKAMFENHTESRKHFVAKMSLSLCIKCGALLRLTGPASVEPLTKAELDELPAEVQTMLQRLQEGAAALRLAQKRMPKPGKARWN